MTCDQDDVWLEKKIELTYDKMLAIEKQMVKSLNPTSMSGVHGAMRGR